MFRLCKRAVRDLLSAAVLTFMFGDSKASVCHTIADGDINDPLIWDCGCMPVDCDTLHIDDAVTVSGSYTCNNAFVNVGSSGSLTSLDTLTFTGLFRNDGVVNVHRLVQPEGTAWWYNNGLLTSSVLWLWGDSALNIGTVHGTDTLNIGPQSHATSFGHLDGNFLWMGGLYNHGTVSFQKAQTDGLLINQGSFNIAGLMVCFAPVYNEPPNSEIQADTILGFSGFQNYGFVRATSLFQLGTADFPEGEVYFFPSNARIECGNLKNHGHIQGQGDICVADSSINYVNGIIDGSPDICDATLAVGSPTEVDVNLGTVSFSVQGCGQTGCVTAIPLVDEVETGFIAYPLPAQREVTVRFPKPGSVAAISIYDLSGRLQQTSARPGTREVVIERGSLPDGLYVVVLRTPNGVILGRTTIAFSK
jgi:hypothetical protein